MLPGVSLPISLRRLLDAFAGCFTTPTFEIFQAMVIGLIAQTGQRTVCGMLTGAGLATSWSHHRAHRFFSTARWQVDQLGLTVFDLVLAHLVTDGTDLLTNYHVVEGLWTQGQRTATIDHDNQRFPVQVVRVDPENDLALLHSTEKFPRLAAATGQVVPGMPIVVIGAPRGFEQSVSSGVVSALRTDIPESAGKTFIQFDAASNPGNSGSPVVNAQKQVIGVVRGNLNGPGLNYAIPISVACRSFDGIC